VKINVDFVKPFAGSSTFERPKGAQSAVTRSMTGHHNFIAKAICLVFNGKKTMGRCHGQGTRQFEIGSGRASNT